MSNFEDEIRRRQLNTDTLIYLRTMTEINFLKFIIYRKLVDYLDLTIIDSEIDEIEKSIVDLLQKLTDWVNLLNTIKHHFPSEEFFEDIEELGKDLDKNKISNLDAYSAFDKLKEVAYNYKLQISGESK